MTGDPLDDLARRVAEILARAPMPAEPPGLLNAGEVAQRLGVERSWVYAHADKLGALRLGDGPKLRLRFDPAVIAQRMTTRRTPTRATTPRRASTVRLLPIKQPGGDRSGRTLE